MANLKFRFSRLRDKRLAFVGLVKHVCNMDIHFHWRVCDSNVKICVSPEGLKNIRNLWFSIIPCKHPPIHAFSSRSFEASVPKCFWQRHGHRLQQGESRRHYDAMSSCKPKSTFFVQNGNKFRGPCVILVKNVITPPPPPDDHRRACATC